MFYKTQKEAIEKIKKDYKNSPDMTFREFNTNNTKIELVFNESLTSSDAINDFILKNLTNIKEKKEIDIQKNLESLIPENKIVEVISYEDIYDKIGNGFTIILLEKKAYATETKGDLSRSISEPVTEQTISGPKDAFNENYQTNIGLIRKRIKTNHLILEEQNIGKQTNTKVGLLYMDNIIEEDLLNDIKQKLEKIDIDGILDSTYIKELIDTSNSVFSTIEESERPDTVAMALLNGKIAIVVENSPYVLTIPNFFKDLFHASEDNYQNAKNVTFTRLIRYISFFIAVITPAYYIAITTYNHETIPATLLINFASQRDGVPFPAIVEALGLSLVFEIIRESDIRMPHISGTAISILGAIVLGDAAVAAGIVSPIMVIVIAITAISSLMFSNIGMVNAIRLWRIIFMLFATCFGIPGIAFALFLLVIDIASLDSFGKPYLYPFAPFNKLFAKQALIKQNIKKVTKRMPILTNKNRTRSRI